MGQRLGQHFLKDVPTLMEISELIEALAEKHELVDCVEIGPGE